jgi:TetR/AcrR family transcriptional repressor of nem operon
MRYATDHKQETRRRLLREAAREIRAKGPNGVAVSGIMARAGLTHGGFYAHFKSKDELVAEAIGTMFDDARARFDKSAADVAPAVALDDYVAFYLSPAHRDARDRGCPLAALGSDLPRLEGSARTRFAAGLETLTSRIADALARHGSQQAHVDAASMVAELVGALSMARAVSDPAQSDAILARSAQAIRARLGLGQAL